MWLWMILLRGDLQPPSAHISPAQGALAKLGSWWGGKRALLGSCHLPFISPGIVSLEETSLACKIWNNSSVKWFVEKLGSPELTEKWVSPKSCEWWEWATSTTAALPGGWWHVCCCWGSGEMQNTAWQLQEVVCTTRKQQAWVKVWFHTWFLWSSWMRTISLAPKGF